MAATAIHRLTLDPMGKCSNAFFSETTNIIRAKLYMNVHWMVLYKLYVFRSDMKFKMAATAGLSLTFDPMGKWFQRRQFFRNQPIRNKNCLWWPCLLTDRDKMINLYRRPSIDASYQVSVHLAKWLQRRRFFRNQPIMNKNGMWRPCLLADRN